MREKNKFKILFKVLKVIVICHAVNNFISLMFDFMEAINFNKSD